jgi:hypothetical protein
LIQSRRIRREHGWENEHFEWEDNIEMDIRETGYESGVRIQNLRTSCWESNPNRPAQVNWIK